MFRLNPYALGAIPNTGKCSDTVGQIQQLLLQANAKGKANLIVPVTITGMMDQATEAGLDPILPTWEVQMGAATVLRQLQAKVGKLEGQPFSCQQASSENKKKVFKIVAIVAAAVGGLLVLSKLAHKPKAPVAGLQPVLSATELPGGLAWKAGVTPADVSPGALARGVQVELEHTSDQSLAQSIVLDHLVEDPNYYEKLAAVWL